MSDDTELLTINEAAKLLKVSRSHIYRLIERHHWDVVPVNTTYAKGGPVRLKREQVLTATHPAPR
jgi:excisionase family DNA binding protein